MEKIKDVEIKLLKLKVETLKKLFIATIDEYVKDKEIKNVLLKTIEITAR